MKKPPVLKINIPNPCSQNWASMPAAGDGKHCSKCNNIIYDFSYMNDEDLLNFFKQKPETHCGRFHNSQLNRDITHTVNRKQIFLTRFNKIAAAFFTVLSFKSLSSKAEFKNHRYETAFDSNYKYKSRDTGITIISGTVTEPNGGPLQNAKVMLDGEQKAVTDKDGKFSFELKQPNLEIEEANFTSRNIYFSYDSLITAVRTYHAAMYSTNYDVVLYKESTGLGMSMGMMLPPGYNEIGDLPSLTFKTNSSKLSADTKALLSSVAARLKEHPDASIQINAYPATCGPQYIYNQRVLNAREYLIKKEGINPKRILTNCEVGGGDTNIVDLKAIEQ